MRSSNKNKGWCQDEDRIINELVQRYGTKNWAQIADQLHQVYGYSRKTGKQCRQRWHNHLDPVIVKKSWSTAEQDILFHQHQKFGNKWTIISQKLPGRTDNSIKNHFYSTVRKSLRRISKFMGSKNSTIKMRQIKPSTLSKIFTYAQSKPNEGANSQSMQFEECRKIAQSLMTFARYKLTDKKYIITQEDVKNFQKILEQMGKINQIYESQKLVEAKIKKQKQLQKNFDRVASSQSEDGSELQQRNYKQDDGPLQKISKKSKQNSFLTRSKRLVRPPSYFDMQTSETKEKFDYLSKQQKMDAQKQYQIKQEYQIGYLNLANEGKRSTQFQLQIQQFQPKQIDQGQGNKFQFLVDLHQNQQVKLRQIDQMSVSPGIKNTPMALTPRTYEFMKDLLPCQPFRNQDCNITANKIINDIKKNTNFQYQAPTRPMFIPSPSSAFRQYC